MSYKVKLGEKTIELHELTEEQEKVLCDLSEKQESDSGKTLCAICRQPVSWVKNGWPLHLIDKFAGCYCSNKECGYFRVFIPKTVYDSLTLN
jgi:hypothetical protein